jgi:hypothetical protein
MARPATMAAGGSVAALALYVPRRTSLAKMKSCEECVRGCAGVWGYAGGVGGCADV